MPEVLVRFGLGDVIRKLRGDETQKQLADRAKIDVGALIYLERGERNSDLQTIRSVAEALHVPLADIIECVEQLKWIDLIAGLEKQHRVQVLNLAKRLAGMPPNSEQFPGVDDDPPVEADEQPDTKQKFQRR